MMDDRLNAFCNDTHAYLPGAKAGPLSGLSFAAKDIYDVAGHVTGGGNPDWKATHAKAVSTSWAVQVLVDAGATDEGALRGERPLWHTGEPGGSRAGPRRLVQRFGSRCGR